MNIITDDLGKGLSTLITKVTLPALIITSMNYEFSREMFSNSMKILIVGFCTYLFMITLSIGFTKLFHTEEPQRGVYKFLIVFSNTGFIGYPIALAMYGEVGIFYGAVFNLLFNFFLWTLGVMLVTPLAADEASAGFFKRIKLKSLINPGIISVIIGFLLFLLSIKLPYVIYSPLKLVGNTTTPLAMMVVGALLGDAKFKEIFGNVRLFAVSGIRLIVIPLVLIFTLSMLNLPDIVVGIIAILSGMPSAANSAIFARIYDSDYKLASQGVFLTTLLGLITIPLMLLILARIQ